MGSFSIWHWAIVLLIIGVPVFFAVRSAVKPSQNPASLAGIGGWLMLLAILQALSPLRTLADLANSAEGYRQLMTQPNGALAAYGEIALNLAFLALQVIVLVSMLRRSHRFPRLFMYQWLAIPLLFILDTLWICSIMGVPVSQLTVGQALLMLLVSFAVTGLWVAYVYRSVRVRNTFINRNTSGRAVSAS